MFPNIAESALLVGRRLFVNMNCVNTAISMSAGHTILHTDTNGRQNSACAHAHPTRESHSDACRSRLTPLTMIGQVTPSVALFAQPVQVGNVGLSVHAPFSAHLATHGTALRDPCPAAPCLPRSTTPSSESRRRLPHRPARALQPTVAK
jgi:hypothetical protein